MLRRALILATITSLTVIATAAGAAPTTTYGTYRGKTAQGLKVRLGPSSNAGDRWFRYRARMSCNDGSKFLDDYFSDDVKVSHNRFSMSYTSNRGAVLTKVTGSLSGAFAGGTVRIVERFSEVKNSSGDTPLAANGAIVCDSGTVHWTARA